jgi:hypothetical protein
MDRAISPPIDAIIHMHQESIIRAHSPPTYDCGKSGSPVNVAPSDPLSCCDIPIQANRKIEAMTWMNRNTLVVSSFLPGVEYQSAHKIAIVMRGGGMSRPAN